MTIAIYAGTFDPFTLGHEDVLQRARQIFDKVIVAVAADTGKKTFFTYEERVHLAQSILEGTDGVEVIGFEGLLSEFVRKSGATVLIRGVRKIHRLGGDVSAFVSPVVCRALASKRSGARTW